MAAEDLRVRRVRVGVLRPLEEPVAELVRVRLRQQAQDPGLPRAPGGPAGLGLLLARGGPVAQRTPVMTRITMADQAEDQRRDHADQEPGDERRRSRGAGAIRTSLGPGRALAGEGHVPVAGVEARNRGPLVVREVAGHRPEVDGGAARRRRRCTGRPAGPRRTAHAPRGPAGRRCTGVSSSPKTASSWVSGRSTVNSAPTKMIGASTSSTPPTTNHTARGRGFLGGRRTAAARRTAVRRTVGRLPP